jgi:hypothetical protein
MIRLIHCTVCLVVLIVSQPTAFADDLSVRATSKTIPNPIREYRSARLFVRTDLSEADAALLYERLEETLRFASRYWGRKSKGQIECYVAHDLTAWTDAQLPHRLSRVIIKGVGGATVPRVVGNGKQARNQPTVFASSKPGVAEHELIHAYCIHTFGSSGPEWYKEGMAEMVVNRCSRESGIRCSAEQFDTLRSKPTLGISKILASGTAGKRISKSLQQMLNDPTMRGQHVSVDAWTTVHDDDVVLAREEYLHSWAFCYMMLHNPNYSKRFRSLGNVFIQDQRNAFDDIFGSVRHRIDFEYELFLNHAKDGYRVDLCAWDWNPNFTKLTSGESNKTRIHACKGFQTSGVTVTSGRRYKYKADGQWTLTSGADPMDANGDRNRNGQLVGIILNDRTLSKPFQLGISGTLRPTTSGKLYLRCQDAWNEIADNAGQVSVTITRK